VVGSRVTARSYLWFCPGVIHLPLAPHGPPGTADLVHPAAHRLGRDREAPFGQQGPCQRGTASARAAPAIGPGRRFEPGHQRLAPCRDPPRRADGWAAPVLVVGLEAQRASPTRPHRVADTGARTEESVGDGRWGASRGTTQPDLEGQQVAVPRAPQRDQHLSLLLWEDLDDETLAPSGVSSLIRGGLTMASVSQKHLAVPIFCGPI
jgi:hypothetical protein